MDDREELVTSEGFDWLYSEDAAGSVVEEPPAIGAVTERAGPFAPGYEEPAGPSEPEGLGTTNPYAIDDMPIADDAFDLSEFDASFGPAVDETPFEAAIEAPVAPEASAAQAPEAPAPVAPAAPVLPPPPPPPSTPSASQTVAPPPSEERPQTVAEIYGPIEQTPPPARPAAEATAQIPVVDEPTTRMAPVSEPTSVIPAPSSRGDIIAAGNRKLTLRDRVTPVGRAPKVTLPEKKAEPSGSRGTRPIVAFLVMALSFGGTLWRMEGVREKIFGNGAPSEADVEAAFTPLKGYTYAEMPPEIEAQMQQMSEAMLPEEVEHLEIRFLGAPPQPQGMVMVISIDPEYATPDMWQKEVQLVQDATARQIKVAGVDAISATVPNGQGEMVVAFADPEGLYFFAMGRSEQMAKDVATQLAKANL